LPSPLSSLLCPGQMLEANKDKVLNLLLRPYKSLPLCTDLPRLISNFRLYDSDGTLLIDETSLTQNPRLGMLLTITTLTKYIEGNDLADKISTTLPSYFKGTDQGTAATTLQAFIDDIMGGDNSSVIRVLKCANQSAISPAIVELKMALGTSPQNMTKDVKNGWIFEFHFKEENLIVISRKKEINIRGLFAFEWMLVFTFERSTWKCISLQLSISDLMFNASCSAEKKTEVQQLLSKYCSKSVLETSNQKKFVLDSNGSIVLEKNTEENLAAERLNAAQHNFNIDTKTSLNENDAKNSNVEDRLVNGIVDKSPSPPRRSEHSQPPSPQTPQPSPVQSPVQCSPSVERPQGDDSARTTASPSLYSAVSTPFPSYQQHALEPSLSQLSLVPATQSLSSQCKLPQSEQEQQPSPPSPPQPQQQPQLQLQQQQQQAQQQQQQHRRQPPRQLQNSHG
jgi:hypothetical protein